MRNFALTSLRVVAIAVTVPFIALIGLGVVGALYFTWVSREVRWLWKAL